MKIQIRNEETKDIEHIRAILCAAFPTDAESKLVEVLREHGKAVISLVAVHEGDVVGHILFSRVFITPAPPIDMKGIGLAPVAVRPEMQSQGIGSQLIREGLQLCKDLGFDYCVVLGSPDYYHRFGFEKASQFQIQNEYGVDDEFMILWLTGRHAAGLVKYVAEFAELSV